MSNGISGDNAPQNNSIIRINTQKDIENLNISAQKKNVLTSIFNKVDAGNDGKINEKTEGSVYLFSDGTVSVMKDDKLVISTTSDDTIYEHNEDGSVKRTVQTENGQEEQFIDANGRVTHGKLSNGTTYENKYNDNGNLLYKTYTTSSGEKYLMSGDGKRTASLNEDGSISTTFTLGDSFDGTMMRLGIKDPENIEKMRQANPEAAKRGYFTLDDNGDNGKQVCIPKDVAEKMDVRKALTQYNTANVFNKVNAKPSAIDAYADAVREEWIELKAEQPLQKPKQEPEE